jgi:uncharacterized protein (TIGR03067 family)
MKRMIGVLFVLLTPLLLVAGDDAAKKELKSLEGKWKTVGMEAGGKAFPKDAVIDFTMIVAADGKTTGATPKGEFKFTMVIDPKKSPKWIVNDHESGPHKGMKQFGIYKLDGDKLTVCVTSAGSPEADRPKDFDTKDTGNVVFVFERVKDEKKPADKQVRADVEGTVTLDGKPIALGAISFFPPDGAAPVAATPIKDGKFALKVPVGKMKVAINVSRPVDNKKDKFEELLPAKYNTNSVLVFEVTAGKNVFDVVLSSK